MTAHHPTFEFESGSYLVFDFETLPAHNGYNKKIEFYGEIVPQIKRMLKILNDPNELIAETIGVCKFNKVIIFEDSNEEGYKMASIQNGFIWPKRRLFKRNWPHSMLFV